MRERTLALLILQRRASVATAAAGVGPDPTGGGASTQDIAARPRAAGRAVARADAVERLRAARVALRNAERIAVR